jgi:ketosteroid isomerase-like protein
MTTTTTTSSHVETIQQLYAAFGRGDVPAILELVSEDVRWEHWADSFLHRAGVPWLTPRSGREGVREFFQIIATFDVSEFQVLDVMAGERQVVAEIVIDASTPDGGRYRDEELHLWTFDETGRICRMRHYVDTAKHIAAASGEDTTR